MFIYEKKLQYPVNIKNCNPKLAQLIISQYGGPDGELGASIRYLSQRYSMPYSEVKAILTDVGTGVSKMFQTAETLDMPCVSGLLIHSMKTMDKVKKYINNNGTDTKIMTGKKERTINLFLA